MKELSIEEKAKRYDEAIERAGNLYKDAIAMEDTLRAKQCVIIFPELKESEDERIRKATIKFVEGSYSFKSYNNFTKEDCIAWLEKQGEQNLAFIEKGKWYVCIRTSYKPNGKDFIEGKTYYAKEDYKIIGECGEVDIATDNPEEFFRSATEEEINDIIKNFVNEQKLTNKVEPKFKVGDWVVDKESKEVFNISKILANTYEIIDIEGNDYHVPHYTLEEKYYLWTIQDAKDGDVLCCESGWTCIFKALDNHTNTFSSYCFMDKYKWFCNIGSGCHIIDKAFNKAYNGDIYPATKEQRDLLFQKMKEAGYEWDARKKILRRFIRTVKPNDENAQSAWSEEDERMCNSSIRACQYMVEHFENSTKDYEDSIDWLKSLKERMKGE